MNVYVQDDGVYIDFGDGRENKLDPCVALVNADGSLTVRFRSSDVTVRQPIDHFRAIPMGAAYVELLKLAVLRGGLTVAEINQVRPAVAAVIQNWLTTNGFTPGTAP